MWHGVNPWNRFCPVRSLFLLFSLLGGLALFCPVRDTGYAEQAPETETGRQRGGPRVAKYVTNKDFVSKHIFLLITLIDFGGLSVPVMKFVALAVLIAVHAATLVAAYTESSYSLCPNFCSGHGLCLNDEATITCSCFEGYHGGDCSYRLCPAGKAWFDFPSADGVAHAEYTECSNMVFTECVASIHLDMY